MQEFPSSTMQLDRPIDRLGRRHAVVALASFSWVALAGCGGGIDGPLGAAAEEQGTLQCDVAIVVGLSGSAFVNNGVPVQGSGQTGTGGYRMYFNQYTYKLGQELAALGQPGQLTFLAQSSFSRLAAVANRGYDAKLTAPTYFTYNNGGVAKYFAPLYNSPINDNDMWKVLLCGPQVPVDAASTPQYEKMAIPGLGNMTTAGYLEWVSANVISPKYGPEVAQYMLDVWRFRGDFEGALDAVSYLQYNAKDFTGGTVYYPIPSFQPYFDIMQAQIGQHGGQIYLNEQVLSVSSESSGPRYVLTTTNHASVTANTVIIAVPHTALDPSSPSAVTGDVISRIASQPQFQYSLAASAVTVTHQFGDGHTPNSGFWHGDITYPNASNLLGPQLTSSSAPLRRSTNNIMIPGDKLPGCTSPSCDFTGTLFYNNTNEMPLTDYHDYINISRSVYNDDDQAVDHWAALYDAGEALSPGGGGNAAVNAQILKSLRVMYPKVFTGNPAAEPQILATQLTVHKPAWYNLKQGAMGAGVDNDSMFAWSLRPLSGEKVYLVGDSWRNDVSGWSDAAYKGSVYVLNTYFGASIDPKDPSTIQCINGDIHDPN
jgi:hypothetical protein